MTCVGFIGLGVMGREMAMRLVSAGHTLRVWNRTPEKSLPFEKTGAHVATSPADAVEGAEAIISMVGDDAASRAIWLGEAGILAGNPAPTAIMIESSTLSRAWVRELGDAVEARGHRFLDCPVTGGPDGAAAGELTLLVGGAEDTIEATWPVLSAYAGRYLHFGGIGAGTAYKVIVNLIGAVQGAAAAEGFALAERAGLDMNRVIEALTSGAVASPHLKFMVERFLAGDHDTPYFSTQWRYKDARYGLRLADELGQPMPTSKTALDLYEMALQRGQADKCESVIVEALRVPNRGLAK